MEELDRREQRQQALEQILRAVYAIPARPADMLWTPTRLTGHPLGCVLSETSEIMFIGEAQSACAEILISHLSQHLMYGPITFLRRISVQDKDDRDHRWFYYEASGPTICYLGCIGNNFSGGGQCARQQMEGIFAFLAHQHELEIADAFVYQPLAGDLISTLNDLLQDPMKKIR